MKEVKKAVFITLIMMFILASSGLSSAIERNIYVGDLIELKITVQDLTEDEVREGFKDFEIVDLKSVPDGFLITVRTFEPGEKTIALGNNEIIITIKSTLEEMDRNELFEGDTSPENPGFPFNYGILFYVLLLASVVTGGILLANCIKKRRDSLKTPYRRFLDRIKKIPVGDSRYLVMITKCLKEYLEEKFKLSIKGKTSTEIIHEISAVRILQPVSGKIHNWLKEMDHYKFSGVFSTDEKKRELLSSLKEIVSEIEKLNEGKA